MRKIIGILLLSLSTISLIACSKNNYQSLDGSIIGSQVKETNWRLLLKEKMLPLSMEKPTALPLTNKRIRSN